MSDNKKLLLKEITGTISHLSEPAPWTESLSAMFDWITWETSAILGVSKSKLYTKAIQHALTHCNKETDLLKVTKSFQKILENEIKDSVKDRYSSKRSGLAHPVEALRRAKFFKEDYLNKEFDLFMNLVPSSYLDSFYSSYFFFNSGNTWTNIGNSGLFKHSLDDSSMQMDNLSYNLNSKILIANELKLGAKKNPDQILKYCYLAANLRKKGFINTDDSFGILFFTHKPHNKNVQVMIEDEIKFCNENGCDWFNKNESLVLQELQKVKVHEVTWNQIVEFNSAYMNERIKKDGADETLLKLLKGFNACLLEKAILQSTVKAA